MVALEAMERARPVIASAVGGLPEIVADGETGLVVRAGDAEALADAIVALAGDLDRAAAMGKPARSARSPSSPRAERRADRGALPPARSASRRARPRRAEPVHSAAIANAPSSASRKSHGDPVAHRPGEDHRGERVVGERSTASATKRLGRDEEADDRERVERGSRRRLHRRARMPRASPLRSRPTRTDRAPEHPSPAREPRLLARVVAPEVEHLVAVEPHLRALVDRRRLPREREVGRELRPGRRPGQLGTSSIQPPRSRTSYVLRLFAFQSARASVVIAKQPTCDPCSGRPRGRRRARRRERGSPTRAPVVPGAPPRDVDGEQTGSSASRAFPRIASPATHPVSRGRPDRPVARTRRARAGRPARAAGRRAPRGSGGRRARRRTDGASPGAPRPLRCPSSGGGCRSRGRRARWRPRPRSARARPRATSGRRASRAPRGTSRRAAACRRRGRREEAEGAVLDERRREAVALVDELLEDRLPLAGEHGEPRQGGASATTRIAVERRIGPADDTPRGMSATPRERYAVVSCHVERPLDDAVWARFSALQGDARAASRSRRCSAHPTPRPARTRAAWLERAREAAARGPLGHHTHWTARTTRGRRPPGPGSACARKASGYASSASRRRSSAEAAGTRTPRSRRPAPSSGTSTARREATRPAYLAAGERWAFLPAPARIRLPSARAARHSDDALARRPGASAPAAAGCPGSSTSTSTTPTSSTAAGGLLDRAPAAARARAEPTDLDALRAASWASRPRSPGTTWPGSKIPRVSKAAPPAAEAASCAGTARRRTRRPRLPRLPPLSRADPPPSSGALRSLRSSCSTSPGSRSGSTSRSSSASSSPARATSSGGSSGARARGVAEVRRADHRARLRAGRPLPRRASAGRARDGSSRRSSSWR